MNTHRPIVLLILDGWGETENTVGNAIAKAQIPTVNKLNQYYPKLLLQASGISVGLPWGECGNSEVGHQTLGTGQIIYQSLPRITMAIESGAFFKNEAFLGAMEWTKKNKSDLHFMGLLSDGAVHSHIDQLFALLELAKEQKVENVYIHAITDGRDTSPNSGAKFITDLERQFKELGIGKLATIVGRSFTMDRNENWERVEKGYLAMVAGKGIKEEDPFEALKKQYQKKIFDEFLEPIVMVGKNGQPIATIKDNDALIFFNYREDRARQITKAFTIPKFDGFNTTKGPKNLKYVGMVEYEKGLPMDIAFPPRKATTCLGQILSENNKKQLRIAETEKYAHVTYFFNGGIEQPFPGEDHILIPSKKVSSYDKIPEMSAREITDKLIAEINKDKYDFILVNYANPDMVGHTGIMNASVKAVEIVDAYLDEIIKAVLAKNGCLLITADHGNVEELINLRTGERDTEHSTNPVPFWLVTPSNHRIKRAGTENPNSISGILSDIAPTVLRLCGIDNPPEMQSDGLLSLL